MPAKKATAKKATAKKATAKKATAKKATAKKATAKKATAKKATAKKATAKKATAKKATAKKATARTKMPSAAPVRARRGDLIVIPSPRVGSPAREGEVLRVIHGEVSVSYEVRWADGRETLLSPGAGNVTIVRT